MYRFNVPGMTCGGCARRVSNALRLLDPAAEVITQPPSREVTVRTTANLQAVLAALEAAGYPAQPLAAGANI